MDTSVTRTRGNPVPSQTLSLTNESSSNSFQKFPHLAPTTFPRRQNPIFPLHPPFSAASINPRSILFPPPATAGCHQSDPICS
uniref:Uncharacterized protein n=1 Tax=Leersia perrieri TaxID=77586 RepID=A0A0D9XW91_9ORYZ